MGKAYIIRSSMFFLALVLITFLVGSVTADTTQPEMFQAGRISKRTSATQSVSDYLDVIITFNEQLVVEKEGINIMSEGATTIKNIPMQIKTNLPIINAVSATIHKDELEALQNHPSVARIEMNEKRYIMLDTSVPLVNAGSVLSGAGYTLNGSGVKVCILDTGYDFFHENLPYLNITTHAKDFTTRDWCIDGKESNSSFKKSYNYSLNINYSFDWLEIGINWICNSTSDCLYYNDDDSCNTTCYGGNRYDIFVYDELNNYVNNTTELVHTYNETGDELYWLKLNLTGMESKNGTWTIVINETDITGTYDYPTLMWGSNITHQIKYWKGCSASPSPYNNNEFNDSRSFANIYPQDDNGHGTHVAGIIASNHGMYSGVAPGVELYIAKVIDSGGSGDTDDIIQGISWCLDQDAKIISMSLGGYNWVTPPTSKTNFNVNCNTSDARAVDNATINHNALVVVAAGNAGTSYRVPGTNVIISGSNTIASPGCARTALTVGATHKSINYMALAAYSSQGPVNAANFLKPDILGPGGIVTDAIFSTHPTNSFKFMSGTSMATPHVAGAAALLLQSNNNSLTAAELKVMLMNSANQIIFSNNFFGNINNTHGAGLVDVLEAVNNTHVLSANMTNNKIQYYTINGTSSKIKATIYWEEFYLEDNITTIHHSMNVSLQRWNETSWVQVDTSTNNSWITHQVGVSGTSSEKWRVLVDGTNVTGNKTFYLATNHFAYPTTTLTLNLPVNNTKTNDSTIIFNYTINSTNLSHCMLWIANASNLPSWNVLNTSEPSNNAINYFNETFVDGVYVWNIECNGTYLDTTFSDFNETNRTFTVDTLPPNVTINAPVNELNTTGTFLLNWTVEDLTLDKIWYKIDNDAPVYVTGVSNATEITIVAEGHQNITVYANDTFNNIGNATINVTVDKTPPSIEIFAPTNETTATGNTTEFNYTVSDTVTIVEHVWYYLDGQLTNAPTNESDNTTIDLTYPGKHFLEIYANDSANNIATSNVTFYSTALMNMTNWTSYANTTWGANATILSVWNGSEQKDNSSVDTSDIFNLSFNTSNFNVTLENFNGSNTAWNWLFDVTENDMDLEIEIELGSGSYLEKMIILRGVSNFLEDDEYTATIKFSPNLSDPELDAYYCSKDDPVFEDCVKIETCIAFDGVNACYKNFDTHAEVYVPHMSVVAVGNNSAPPNITINSPNDTTYTDGNVIYNLKANISFPADVVYCNYTLWNSTTEINTSSTVGDILGTRNYEWVIGPLKNNTYNITFFCKDEFDNPSDFETVSFKINDTTAPAFASGPSFSREDRSAEIYWTTNEPTTGTVYLYKTSGCNETVDDTASTIDYNKSHIVEFTGLSPDTTYYYNVRIWDFHRNSNYSTCRSFTTRQSEAQDAIGDGGGGGPGAQSNLTGVLKESHFIELLQPNTELRLVIRSVNIPAREITLKTSQLIQNGEVVVETFGPVQPRGYPDAPNNVYHYFDISSSFSDVISLLKVKFSIPATWFTSNNYDPEQVELYYFNPTTRVWQKERLTYSGTSGSNQIYNTEMTHLSKFALSTVESPPQPDEPEATATQQTIGACGDGICDADEDCSICPEDCGECDLVATTDTSEGFTLQKIKDGIVNNKFVVIGAVIASLVVVLVYVVFVMEPKSNNETSYSKTNRGGKIMPARKEKRDVSETRKPFFKKPEIRVPRVKMPLFSRIKNKLKKKKDDFELEPGLFKLK